LELEGFLEEEKDLRRVQEKEAREADFPHQEEKLGLRGRLNAREEKDLAVANKKIANHSATMGHLMEDEKRLRTEHETEKEKLETDLTQALNAQEIATLAAAKAFKENQELLAKVSALEEIKGAAISVMHFLFPGVVVESSAGPL
ncbi:hypothetical protein EJB05_30621, partial [Eragrostis curvula]